MWPFPRIQAVEAKGDPSLVGFAVEVIIAAYIGSNTGKRDYYPI